MMRSQDCRTASNLTEPWKILFQKVRRDRCAILCMNLDRFKAVNDTYGHQAGDTVIKTLANRIAGAVGETGMAVRIGGDEFIVLLRDRLDHQNVLGLCDELISSVCEKINFDGGSAMVGASIGVAWWPDDAKRPRPSSAEPTRLSTAQKKTAAAILHVMLARSPTAKSRLKEIQSSSRNSALAKISGILSQLSCNHRENIPGLASLGRDDIDIKPGARSLR